MKLNFYIQDANSNAGEWVSYKDILERGIGALTFEDLGYMDGNITKLDSNFNIGEIKDNGDAFCTEIIEFIEQSKININDLEEYIQELARCWNIFEVSEYIQILTKLNKGEIAVNSINGVIKLKDSFYFINVNK